MGKNQKLTAVRPLAAGAFLVLGLFGTACEPGGQSEPAIQPFYDPGTGRLQQLRYDSDKNGTVETVSFMDGATLLRIEIDKDEDGRVDRWEHYGPDRRLEKVGFSRPNDGKEDAWSFLGADGSVVRIEMSTERDGRVSRVEHFDHGALQRVEVDDDGNGRMDHWETYDGDRLAAVAFDTTGRGKPDRRLTYAKDGTTRLEVDPDGDGNFGVSP